LVGARHHFLSALGAVAARRHEPLERRLRRGLRALGESIQPRQNTKRPPWPLPTAEGVVFLESVSAIHDEGERMSSCVGTHASRALLGTSFIFHIEHQGDRATAELDADGAFRELAGFANARDTPACLYARAVFERHRRERHRARSDHQSE
jgi:hypothetical protein